MSFTRNKVKVNLQIIVILYYYCKYCTNYCIFITKCAYALEYKLVPLYFHNYNFDFDWGMKKVSIYHV